MSVVKSSRKGKNVFSQMAEIRKCNDLRCRIKAYLKQESLTQPQLAEKMGVSAKQMSSFMTGSSLTGSEVYVNGMKYLKVKMPLSKCSTEERSQIVNNKFEFAWERFGDKSFRIV